MFLGPLFARELATAPRRPRHYAYRAVYVLVLLILFWTAWLVVAGTQIIDSVGDMARFGSILFQLIAPLHLALLYFVAAFGAASAVALEKDRRTLILLLMTRLHNWQLVLGKLLAGMLDVLVLLAASFPVFMLATLFGGISFAQVMRVFLVTLTSVLAAGSLGCLLAFWREKTFQTLSMTALSLVIWVVIWEGVHAGIVFRELGGVSCELWAAAFSPLRAIMAATHPRVPGVATSGMFLDAVPVYAGISLALAALLNAWSIARVRVWNPSREARPGQADQAVASIWGVDQNQAAIPASGEGGSFAGEGTAAAWDAAEAARSQHVDARRAPISARKSREVWDNPVLWREICTWAYGRKVLVIRLAYLGLFLMAAAGLYASMAAESLGPGELAGVVPAPAKALAPFFLVSVVIINALAVNSITNERDGQTLDLLLVSDLSPREFVLGKLGGVLWLAKEMVLLPWALSGYLWWSGSLTLESLAYLAAGLLVIDVFVSTLGIHCGMTYANSRTAMGTSLGVVFFLFVGVVTCIVMMVSFSGSFQTQLTPFLAFVMGGSIGLYVALGSRNPSSAIFWAALLLPVSTFFAIVSYVLRDRDLTVLLVIAATYGFTTAAMLVPAISEFDIAMGRTKTPGEE